MPKAKDSIIMTKDEPVLREVALPVHIKEIKSKEIQNLLGKMSRALHREDDGVAIAAPQIGSSLRIFMVNAQALMAIEAGEENAKESEKIPDLVFINPELKKLSQKKSWMEEGCLSVRWLYGKVKRSDKATVTAYDENGKKFEKGASGLLAQIFQHEIDHLDGILFIDKAKDLEDIPPHNAKKI
jgi:peptide deformylase